MDPGVFDVLHDPGDKSIFSVGDRVHIHLDRVLHEFIDQNRLALRNLMRLVDKRQELLFIVHNAHGAAA